MINFNLYEVIDNVVNIVEYRAREKNLDLIIICGREVNPYLHGDPLRLGQIIINLVNNGIKFTEQGEVSIIISKKETSTYRFEIRDTGVGLSEKQQQKLFQPFSQADGSTTRKYGGSGLGLAISRQLVGLMGGRIWVESSFGKGSSFIFEVNLHEQQNSRSTPVTFEDKRILIVDDTPAWRTCLRKLLEKYHFHIDEAASGEEAVERVEHMTSCYDLILMDWKMTGLDGISTTEKINRFHKVGRQATVMMISAFRQQHLVDAARKAGIEIFLTKPVTPSMLDSVIFTVFAPEMLNPCEKTEPLALAACNNESFHDTSILLVEDNEMNRDIVLSLLGENEISIDIATNGLEAVTMVKSKKRQHYGLVLMDIQMPVMDGFEASELIKKIDPHLPIIALTANVMIQDIRKIKSSGMDDILEKPLVPEKFFKIILKYLSPADTRHLTEKAEQSTTGETSLYTTLDINKGLVHFNGDRKLYRKILNDFIVNFKNAGEDLKHLQTTDRTAAERLIHTIKGLAGNIGASALYNQAEKLEKEFTPIQVEQFIELLTEVFEDITKQSSHEKPSFTGTILSPREITVLFQELARELKTERILKCRPLLEKLENTELAKKDRKLIIKIRHHLENFDFARALTTLQQREP
ncbi:response regulator [Desulfomarina sp.]